MGPKPTFQGCLGWMLFKVIFLERISGSGIICRIFGMTSFWTCLIVFGCRVSDLWYRGRIPQSLTTSYAEAVESGYHPQFAIVSVEH